MNDLISRQAVLMSLADYQLQESPNWGANGMGNTDAYEAITECIRVIEQAPTIDPVRRGKWIPFEFGDETWHKCTACGVADQYGTKHISHIPGKFHIVYAIRNYCPNCGARME